MSVLTVVQIKEANAHLAALHRKVAELESTVREQAESLIRKDEQLRTAVRDITDTKDREIFQCQHRLAQSEQVTQRLMNSIKEKDREVERLRHQGRFLAQICRSRPLLCTLVTIMGEAEGVSDQPIPGEPNGLGNQDHLQSESELEDSDVDRTLFGTTV